MVKKDIRSQESNLRNRPDVIIGTPGRIIDHLRNSRSVTLDDLDVLVLDEVDRLLDLGFKDELEEIVRFCPHNRQTMLFSATMTSGVDDLVKLSLKRPIRIKTMGDATTVAPKLVQEFIRVRHADEREAILASLVCRNFSEKIEQMKLRDEYLDDEVIGGKTKVSGGHRMSRKKKRRQEALKEVEENDQDMKVAAKRLKVSDREKEQKERDKTGSELGLHRKSKKSDTDAKIFRPVIAVGGLDQDMNEWRGGGKGGTGGKGLKRQLKKEREEEFTEFDPNKKLRKGGKLGKQAFKSKSRFKRR